jgi:PBSX family phage terminase large subunit
VIFKIKKDKMLKHQLQFWDMPNRIVLLIGGYGSGKTYIGALKSIQMSYINRPIPQMYISPSHQLATKTIIVTLKEICNRAGLDYTYNQQRAEFKIHNWDGTIWFGSGDKPDSLRGPNIASAIIDEPFIQKREVFEQMIARVRHPEAAKSQIFLTGTPEQLNWGFTLANNKEMDIGVIQASTLDNPHLPDDYKETLLKSYSKEQIDAYVHGKFVNLTQGRVYHEFDRNKHIQTRNDLQSWDVGCGVDFNVDQLSACIFRHTKDEIHVEKEIRLKNAGTYDLVEHLKKIYPAIKVYPDSSGSARKTSAPHTDHDIMKMAGFQVLSPRANPPVKDRVNSVNRLLREGRLTVDGSCKYTIMDLEQNVWRNQQIDTRDPEHGHMLDALGYGCSWLMPIVPKTVGYSRW